MNLGEAFIEILIKLQGSNEAKKQIEAMAQDIAKSLEGLGSIPNSVRRQLNSLLENIVSQESINKAITTVNLFILFFHEKSYNKVCGV